MRRGLPFFMRPSPAVCKIRDRIKGGGAPDFAVHKRCGTSEKPEAPNAAVYEICECLKGG